MRLVDKQFVAFGNDANDISMFQHALHAVMTGNNERMRQSMRTEDQVKRKLNELMMQKKSLESNENESLKAQIIRLEDQIMLLEWVLNNPIGSYHV